MTSSMFCFRMQAGGKTVRSDITDRDRGCRVMIWPWLCAVRWGWAIHTTAGSLTGWGHREFLQSAPCSWGDCCQELLGSGYGPERTEKDTWWGGGLQLICAQFIFTQIFVRHERIKGNCVTTRSDRLSSFHCWQSACWKRPMMNFLDMNHICFFE